MRPKMLFKPAKLLLLVIVLTFFAGHLAASPGPSAAWSRFSQYVPVRDGTKIALDCYLPDRSAASHGVEGRYPVILRFTPYGRRLASTPPQKFPPDGAGLNGPKVLQRFIQRGYAVCIADARGYGASFGFRSTWLGLQDARDVRDIIDWLGVQSWSNRNVGMIGSSWLGSVQYWALVEPSHYLKAVFAGKAQYDHYATFFDNGIYRPDLERAWQNVRDIVDFGDDGTGVAAVDGDQGAAQLKAARADHRANTQLGAQIRPLIFRESVDTETGQSWHLNNSVWFHGPLQTNQPVAVYHVAGWWDAYLKAQFLAYSNFGGPQKLHVGPYFHGETFGMDLIDEAVRWFDHWLLDVDNGIMSEPAIRFYRIGAGWEQHVKWSASGDKALELYLGSDLERMHGPKATGQRPVTRPASINEDFLKRNNGTFRTGLCADKDPAPSGCYSFPNLENMGLPFNSETQRFSLSLSRDLEVTGHPLATLWLSPLSNDTEISIVLATDLDDGQQGYVSAAILKASHRQHSKPPINHLGLPWLNQGELDVEQMSPGPTLIEVDLQPVAARFSAGSTLTLMITAIQPSPQGGGSPQPLEIDQRDGHRSSLRLPVNSEAML